MGTIMGLNPKEFDSYPNNDPFYILSENKILELVIFTSAAFFTVSTEIRLRETEDGLHFAHDTIKHLRMKNN